MWILADFYTRLQQRFYTQMYESFTRSATSSSDHIPLGKYVEMLCRHVIDKYWLNRVGSHHVATCLPPEVSADVYRGSDSAGSRGSHPAATCE